MEDYFSLMKQIDEIIEKINIILNAELTINIDDSSGEMFPTMGQRGEWNYNIKRIANELIREFYKYSHFCKLEDLPDILKYFTKLNDKLNDAFIALNNATNENYQTINDRLEEVKLFIENSIDINKLSFEYNNAITQDQIKSLYDKIKNRVANFDNESNIFDYLQYGNDPDKRKFILSKLVDLYNSSYQASTAESGRRIEKIIQQITEAVNIENSANEVKEIAQQFKENVSRLIEVKLLENYNDEAEKLEKVIKNLNFWIIFCIVIVVLVMSLKIIFIVALKDFFQDVWNFTSFIFLIFSFSALITYLIKDRNRLLKLYNHYNLNRLELAALPVYMGELDTQQRKDLYISLAPNYFKGIYPDKDGSSEGEKRDIETLTKTLDSISKLIQDNNKK